MQILFLIHFLKKFFFKFCSLNHYFNENILYFLYEIKADIFMKSSNLFKFLMEKNCKGNMQPREIDITLYSLETAFKNTVRLFENIFITCL